MSSDIRNQMLVDSIAVVLGDIGVKIEQIEMNTETKKIQIIGECSFIMPNEPCEIKTENG